MLIATTPSLGFYFGVIVLAVFAPRVAAFGYLMVAIIIVLRAHGDQNNALKGRQAIASVRPRPAGSPDPCRCSRDSVKRWPSER